MRYAPFMLACIAWPSITAHAQPALDTHLLGEYGAALSTSSTTELLAAGGQAVVGDAEGDHKALGIGFIFSLFDIRPPRTKLVIGTPRVDGEPVMVSSRTLLGLLAVDDFLISGDGFGVGVRDTYFAVDDAPFQEYRSSFSLAANGIHSVHWFSRDRAGNREDIQSRDILVDATPPIAALTSPPEDHAGICSVIEGRVPIIGQAQDLHFKNYRLEFAPGQDASQGFVLVSSSERPVDSGVLGTWDAQVLSGWHTLRLTVTDQVENVSVVSFNVFVGDPGRLMVLGDHKLFNMPEGIAVSADERLFVADTNNDRIAIFSATGTLLTELGTNKGHDDENDRPSTATLRLNKPRGIAVDGAGNVYVADTNRDRALKLSATGYVLLELTGFNKPSGVAIDPGGNIYVADTKGNRVHKFDPKGNPLLSFALPQIPDREREKSDGDESELGEPFGVAVDNQRRIYVADSKGARLLVFDGTGRLLTSVAIDRFNADGKRELGSPEGVAVSPSGDCILVSDRKFHRVLKFDSLWNLTLEFGTHGKIPDNKPLPKKLVLNKPIGLALGPDGSLYVADRNNDRIQRFSLPTGRPPLVFPSPTLDDDQVARDIVDRETGGIVARRDKAAVVVPPGAVAEDLKIVVSSAPTGSETQKQAKANGIDDKDLKVAYAAVEYGPEETSFKTPVTLILPYSESLTKAQGLSEEALRIHYWNAKNGEWEELASKVDRVNKTVTAKTTHFSLYQVLGVPGANGPSEGPSADPTFVLRDVYAFPNPARAGAKPVIHVAVGVADRVNIRVYDIAGREVHRATLDHPPAIIDDGTGYKYAYEHVWEGRIASGVYLYTIEAKRTGHPDIRKTGKLAVVR